MIIWSEAASTFKKADATHTHLEFNLSQTSKQASKIIIISKFIYQTITNLLIERNENALIYDWMNDWLIYQRFFFKQKNDFKPKIMNMNKI